MEGGIWVSKLICAGCRKRPDELPDVLDRVDRDDPMMATPTLVVEHDEGTYEPRFNRFLCDYCYIKLGMPLAKDLPDIYKSLK